MDDKNKRLLLTKINNTIYNQKQILKIRECITNRKVVYGNTKKRTAIMKENGFSGGLLLWNKWIFQ